MEHIFISYSSKDFETANVIRNYLNDICFVWMAPFSIPAGSNYAEEIPKAIEASSTFVLLLSLNSIKSKWVERELDNAIRFNLKIIPVVVENCELTPSFSFYLSNCQMIDATSDFAKSMNELGALFNTEDSDRSKDSWIERYNNAVAKKLHVSNTVFTLLDLEYTDRNSAGLLELNSLLFEYEKFKEKQLDYLCLNQQVCRFIVHGRAGCGKSTLLQNLFYETVKNKNTQENLAIYLPLKSYMPGSLLSLEALYDSVVSFIPGLVTIQEFSDYIRAHKLICFFDAFDEYELDKSEKRKVLWDEITEFSNQYECSVVVSSRTEQMPDDPRFDYVFIRPFSEPQVEEFIRKYFKYFDVKDSVENFIGRLSKGIRGVLHTPLIISMVVAVYIKTKRIPTDENQLYNIILRELLGFKALMPKHVCSVDDKFLILSKIAFEILITGRTYLPFQTFIDTLADVITKCNANIDEFEFYKDIMHSGIVESTGNNVFFFHASVLEYLSRCEINREYNFESKATMDQYFLKNSSKISK